MTLVGVRGLLLDASRACQSLSTPDAVEQGDHRGAAADGFGSGGRGTADAAGVEMGLPFHVRVVRVVIGIV